MESTFVTDMETKIETTNTGGKVLAYDGDELVGRLDFSFKGNVLSIDHTYAYKEGMGVGSLLIRRSLVPEASAISGYSRISDLTFRIQLYFPRLWTSSTNRFISQYQSLMTNSKVKFLLTSDRFDIKELDAV